MDCQPTICGNSVGVLNIKLSDYGASLGPRVTGEEIKNLVLQELAKDPTLVINFDFTGLRSISSGFAFELFGQLSRIMGKRFFEVVKLKISETDDPELAKTIVREAISRGADIVRKD